LLYLLKCSFSFGYAWLLEAPCVGSSEPLSTDTTLLEVGDWEELPLSSLEAGVLDVGMSDEELVFGGVVSE